MLLLLQLLEWWKLLPFPLPEIAIPFPPKKNTPEVDSAVRSGLREIGIRRLVGIRATIQIIAFHQAFYPLLDHVNVWLEAVGELLDHFGDELLMGEMLSLSVLIWGVSIHPLSQTSA